MRFLENPERAEHVLRACVSAFGRFYLLPLFITFAFLSICHPYSADAFAGSEADSERALLPRETAAKLRGPCEHVLHYDRRHFSVPSYIVALHLFAAERMTPFINGLFARPSNRAGEKMGWHAKLTEKYVTRCVGVLSMSTVNHLCEGSGTLLIWRYGG